MKKNSYIEAIRLSGITIYDELEVDSKLRIPTDDLEKILKNNLVGIDTSNLPIRTRSRFVKEKICLSMGYPIPQSFRRTHPRFPGQDLDTYVQRSRNLQIWNENITLTRRYAIIVLSPECIIWDVKIITGQELQLLDKTGKLTTKYQAILRAKNEHGLLSKFDSANLQKVIGGGMTKKFETSPIAPPTIGQILPIQELHNRLKQLEGKEFNYTGAIQERNRGEVLHKAVCEALGYREYSDNGKFPDVRAQLLEVKLQTSRTVDLGLVMPNDKNPIESLEFDNILVSPFDVRYALFEAVRGEGYTTFRIEKVYLVTGADFFEHFDVMKGKGQNRKLQIPLQKSWFPQSSTP